MKRLTLPCEAGEVSDGYHTFNELYEHRHILLLLAMKFRPELAWISAKHDDGSEIEGWFIAGFDLPPGPVTYHLPVRLWTPACNTGVSVLKTGRKWDGSNSQEAIERLYRFVSVSYREGL